MQAVGRLSSYITRGVYTFSGPFHPFGGAVDIIIVQQEDGNFKSSPWYVKFGKFQGVLKTKKKVVNISVNGIEAGFHMYLNHKGEAYFLREVDGGEEDSGCLSPSSSNKTDEKSQNGMLIKAESLNLDNTQSSPVTQVDMSNGKIVEKTNSSRIFGLKFGQKSMKDNSRRGKGDIRMERISSLERAEMAADLLEMKWSTNLPTNNRKLKYSSKPSAPETTTEEANKDIKVSDRQAPEIVTTNYSDEMSCLRSQEQVLVVPTLEVSDFTDSHEVTSELSAEEVNDVCEQNDGSDVMENRPDFKVSSLDLEDELIVHSSDFTPSNTEHASDKIDVPIKCYVSREECGERRVSSYIHSGTPISSSVGVDVYGEVLETPDFSSRGYKEVEFSSEVSYETSELISKENSQPESGVPIGTENSNTENCSECNRWNLGLPRSEDSGSHNSKASYACEEISEISIVKSPNGTPSMDDVGKTLIESHPSVDIYLLSSETVEVTQDAIVESLMPGKTMEMIDNFESQAQMISPTHLVSSNEVIDEKASTQPDSYLRGSIEEAQIHTFSHLGTSINRVQGIENPGEGVKTHELHLSSEVIIGSQKDSMSFSPVKLVNSSMRSSDSLEEHQFLFSDINNFGPVSADAVRIDNFSTEDSEEEHGSNDMYHETSVSSIQSFGSRSFSITGSYPGNLVQESPPNTIEVFPEEIRAQSSPICLPRGQIHAGEVEQSARSLPNIRGHMHDLEWSDVQPLSRSLDVNSGNPNWGLLRNDFSITSMTNAIFESSPTTVLTTDVIAAVVDTQNAWEHEYIATNPSVEMSLCKHLLFEGMGAEAASEAFDTEKVDLEKFRNLGPSVVKNDKLIVRVAGRYFPWDAVAPIILGMVSVDQECILEPEGMIAVERVEKTPISELSATVVPSGGGWRLWPFRFRKMEIANSTQPPPPDATKGTDADNASESPQDKSVNKNKATKRKVVRSIVPTSEQLASLNLKEGRNVITFTFSTAMLGRQQVDATIYLWKWNTRIVVSDVDGTITKSDVLGQFMPLVGKDWSQTGVAQLFSAIKENGYQLLFLSARAISQAYLTRQFLFNLKQDGKALPDGPVVISPDGVFPSLFREVIRRAPHEFKIACLEEIRALFPPDCNPFYAGFGNRDTDEISYLKVGIPKGKIFIINPKGEVVVNRRLNTKSYTSLHSLVNGMFPPTTSAEQEDFNSWNYWKMPLPELNL